MDINGYDLDGGVTTLEAIIRSAIGIDVADGVVFDASTIHVRKERDGQSVPGGKVELKARIHTSEVTVRVDAGFGNSVVPNATLAEYPSILPDMPRPTVLVYPFETTIAEKLHAMARHGAATTRIRDYYDLWLLSERHEFDGALLAEAVSSTFKRHATRVPGADMDALSDSFASLNRREWDKFRKGKGLRFQAPEMAAVVDRIREFVGPALDMATGGPDPGHWCGQGGWHCPTPAP
jgi:hypothetical protein